MTTQLADSVSSDTLATHLQEIIVEYESYKKQFRRTDTREAVSIPVEVTELSEDFEPTSEPLHMVTRDMSVGGTGIFHTENLECDYALLKFSSPVSLEEFSVLAKVEHSTRCGRYFIIGCRFVPDLAKELE